MGLTTRVVCHKKRLNEWFPRQRNSKQKMMLTEIVLKQRMVSRIIASVSSHPLTLNKLKIRSMQVIRRHLKTRLKKLPNLQKMGGGAPGAGGMPDMGGMGGMPDMSGMGGMPGAGGAPPAADPASGPTIEEID